MEDTTASNRVARCVCREGDSREQHSSSISFETRRIMACHQSPGARGLGGGLFSVLGTAERAHASDATKSVWSWDVLKLVRNGDQAAVAFFGGDDYVCPSLRQHKSAERCSTTVVEVVDFHPACSFAKSYCKPRVSNSLLEEAGQPAIINNNNNTTWPSHIRTRSSTSHLARVSHKKILQSGLSFQPTLPLRVSLMPRFSPPEARYWCWPRSLPFPSNSDCPPSPARASILGPSRRIPTASICCHAALSMTRGAARIAAPLRVTGQQ